MRNIDFKPSITFLMFYDKLEKAAVFLHRFLDKKLDERTKIYLLDEPISDGGTWSMFCHLVSKYGITTEYSYPETYQAKNTGGRKLQTKSKLDIFGKEVDISLNWETFSFSTHAGHKEITEFVYSCNPQDVIIYHTDPKNARPHLVDELENNGITTHSPENGKSYIIE